MELQGYSSESMFFSKSIPSQIVPGKITGFAIPGMLPDRSI